MIEAHIREAGMEEGQVVVRRFLKGKLLGKVLVFVVIDGSHVCCLKGDRHG